MTSVFSARGAPSAAVKLSRTKDARVQVHGRRRRLCREAAASCWQENMVHFEFGAVSPSHRIVFVIMKTSGHPRAACELIICSFPPATSFAHFRASTDFCPETWPAMQRAESNEADPNRQQIRQLILSLRMAAIGGALSSVAPLSQ